MNEMVPHPAIIYDLPLTDEAVLLRPETVILRFPHGKTVDIGALCYLQREAPSIYEGKRRPWIGRRVDLQSLNNERITIVRSLITYISNNLKHSGRRVETTRDNTSRFVAFMSWADKNGYVNTLNDIKEVQPVLRAYVEHIREQVATNAITNNHGARQQAAVLSFVSEFFATDDLHRGFNLLRVNHTAKVATPPPDDNAQARVLALCESLFDGLSALILDKKNYPHQILLPKYLNYPNDTLWVFPTTSWFRTPLMEAERLSKGFQCGGYNYNNGRLFTQQELRNEYTNKKNCELRQILSKSDNQLEIANCNWQHVQRRRVAAQALNLFFLLFIAQTGMNLAQVTNLSWSDNHVVSTTNQSFRTIKWRASNREVFFELPVSFMPKFKRYLELRKYLLNETPCDLLFFKTKEGAHGSPTQFKTGLESIYLMLRRLDPDLPKVLPRQWRAAKSDWLIRNTDPSTTALVLQNSEKTVLASYAAGSETVHLEEMTNFLEEMSKIVIAEGQALTGGVNLAIGVCSKFGVPHQASNAPVHSNCKGQEGCLFCDKFKIHADAEDTRKLLSCRYYLYQAAPLAGSEEQRNSMLGPIFNRIELILNEISQQDSNLVSKITHEVEVEGELSPYWARKLEMLMDLGIVIV